MCPTEEKSEANLQLVVNSPGVNGEAHKGDELWPLSCHNLKAHGVSHNKAKASPRSERQSDPTKVTPRDRSTTTD